VDDSSSLLEPVVPFKGPPARLPAESRGSQVGWIFIASLAMFFLAGMVAYVCVVSLLMRRNEGLVGIQIPWSLLWSSACLIVVTVGVQWGAWNVRRDHIVSASRWLKLALVLATVFLAIQAQGLAAMFLTRDGNQAYSVIALAVVLGVLHALHVIGGVLALGWVVIRTDRGHYDHERHWPVDFAAHYWHFLDLVWVCLLFSFWLTSGGFG
jgi:cytochrome c oxidase subunit III